MDRETFVYVDLDGTPHLMGRMCGSGSFRL
jgi:hypothetical protein